MNYVRSRNHYNQYLEDWLKGKRYSISKQTYQVTDYYIRNQINHLLGNYSLSQLNPMILPLFINELIDKGLANSSVKRIFSIHAPLDMAEKMQLIPKNYASLVHKTKLRRKECLVKRGSPLVGKLEGC